MARREEVLVEKDLKKLSVYLRSPRTMEQICDKFDITRTTVYSWFGKMNSQVTRVGTSRPTLYKVIKT